MEIVQTNNILTVNSPSLSGYSYVHVVTKVTTSEETIILSNITEATSTFTLLTDGYYVVTEIKLPDTVTVDNYYILAGRVYDDNGEEITITELMNVDPTGTNILREDLDYFIYYFLEKYYIDLIKSQFLKAICTCGCGDKHTSLTIDTLTMGVDLIKYLITYEQYMEAERIMEQLSVCTGIINTNCNCYG